MIILFMLFLIQFSIASSCLAVNSVQQQQFAEHGWKTVPPQLRKQVQDSFLCCGFNATTTSVTSINGNTEDEEPSCEIINRECCVSSTDPLCHCEPCGPLLEGKIDYAFKLCGGLGIFFSFTEVSVTRGYPTFGLIYNLFQLCFLNDMHSVRWCLANSALSQSKGSARLAQRLPLNCTTNP